MELCMKTLLLFSHTFFKDSKVNKALLESAKTLSNVTIHNLNLTYPSGEINIKSEITLLEQHQKIIFQFPLFWFSTPSLMKEWQDRILSHILHSKNPKLLQGKQFSIITTAGGDEKSYDGHHGYSLETLLSPIYHSFAYLGCEILPTYCIYNANAENLSTKEYLSHLN